MINLIFLVIYMLLADMLSGVDLYYLLSCHALLCIIIHLRQKKNMITPIFMFYVSILLVNYANLGVIAKMGNEGYREHSYLVPRYIDEAVKLWCVSCTLIIIGYNLTLDKSLPPIDFEVNKGKFFKTLFIVLLILNIQIVSVILFNFGMRIPTNFRKFFALLNLFSILFFARLWTKEDSKKYRLFALSLWFLQTYTALISAFLRFDLIAPSVVLFTGYFIGKGEIKYLFTYRVIPFILILSIYSSNFKSLQKNRSNFYAVIFEDANDNSDEKEKENSGALLERSSNLPQLTCVVNLVKQNGFYNGAASAPLIAALVPRVIWPDKPLIQLGAWFAVEINGGAKTGIKNTNSINMSVPGELYLDFGWFGLALGSLLFGAFFPLVWNSSRFYSSEYNLAGTVFGGYLLITASGGLGADLQIVITLMSMYVGFYIIKKIAPKIIK